ncbi:uncharacterized protein CXorf65 homolog, partial [Alligator mississippiensis]|uniref:uncharacterized protein CXorf65 homolog n=1 Tax=Alligator mississippiensis TaxID=8496 RepID=UPI002877CEC9
RHNTWGPAAGPCCPRRTAPAAAGCSSASGTEVRGRGRGAGCGARSPARPPQLRVPADRRQFLANTDCPVPLLLQYVRARLGLPPAEPIDLCDELGALKLLFLPKAPGDRAAKFLAPRGTYHVCRLQRGAPGTKQETSYRAFVPLLKDPEPELLEALRAQCELLEKNRLKLSRGPDGKRAAPLDALLGLAPSQILGRAGARAGPAPAAAAEEEGAPRRAGPPPRARQDSARRDKHRAAQ